MKRCGGGSGSAAEASEKTAVTPVAAERRYDHGFDDGPHIYAEAQQEILEWCAYPSPFHWARNVLEGEGSDHDEEEDKRHDRLTEDLSRSLLVLFPTVLAEVVVYRCDGFVGAVVLGGDIGRGGCR